MVDAANDADTLYLHGWTLLGAVVAGKYWSVAAGDPCAADSKRYPGVVGKKCFIINDVNLRLREHIMLYYCTLRTLVRSCSNMMVKILVRCDRI